MRAGLPGVFTRSIAWVPLIILAGCSSLGQPDLQLSVKDQDVPVIVLIGPFDTSKVQFEDNSPIPNIQWSLQHTFEDALKRTGVFKEVKILKIEGNKEKIVDSEQVLNLARAQNADLLLTGDVKEFVATMSLPTPRTDFSIKMKLGAQLYNLHTGRLVWRKSDSTEIARTQLGRQAAIEDIVRYIAVPSLSAGILPGMVSYVQTAYVQNFGLASKPSSTDDPAMVFGGAELVKIDADLAPPETRAVPKDNAYAIVVGVEDYRDLPKVDYARRDAEMVKKYLIKSMGYREQNVVLLLGDRVTRSQLAARFENWLPKQVGDSNDAEVFVYYGGHGAPDPSTNQAFLVPYDGDPAFLEATAYPLNRLYKILSDLPAKRVIVALDTCFSGAGGRSVISKGTRPMLIKVDGPQIGGPNLVVLTAAAGNQVSSAYMDKRHGLFTYYFLKGLQGEADANKDHTVELQELSAYLKANVEAIARRMNVDQSPQLMPSIEALGSRAKMSMIEMK